MRIGIIGCGRISGKHFEAIERFDELELICVCDVRKDRADNAAEENSCKAYYSIDKMLEDEQLDLVSICTPSGLHPEHGIKVAE
ncbi:MAG: Gfo/Idh/MocA family protein, partial [Candidatus Muiribacteriaceae bacterium]